jgi:hypothetical protein
MTCHTVRTTRTFPPDLPLCREASNCSNLHPSGCFNSTSGRHSVFGQLWDFLPKHCYGKIAATVQMTWIPVRTCSSIRQVSHSKSRCSDVSPLRPDVRAPDQPSGGPSPWSGRAKPWYENFLQRKCDRLDDRAPPSGQGLNQ